MMLRFGIATESTRKSIQCETSLPNGLVLCIAAVAAMALANALGCIDCSIGKGMWTLLIFCQKDCVLLTLKWLYEGQAILKGLH